MEDDAPSPDLTESGNDDDVNSETDQPNQGVVPPGASGKMPREVEGFAFEQDANRSPFIEALTAVIKARQEQAQQRKLSMDINAQVLRSFQDELSHIQTEKRAFIGALGGATMRLAGKGARAMGKGKQFGGAVGKGMKALGGGAQGTQRMRKAVGAGVLGTGAAIGTGAALS